MIPSLNPLYRPVQHEILSYRGGKVGVSAVPGSSFHSPKELGRTMVRFMFAKRDETLHEAGQRLQNIRTLTESRGS